MKKIQGVAQGHDKLFGRNKKGNYGLNIIQFLPYFPPHKGGLETVGEEISEYWGKNNFGKIINITSNYDQNNIVDKGKEVIFEGENIGYIKDGYEVLITPSFELISNFPIYKIWSKKYKLIKKYLNKEIKNNEENFRIVTHTRFFISTLLGGLFAKKNRVKWIHLEHGSSYVLLSSKIITYFSIIYDKSIGKYIFKKADKIISISKASKDFILNKFIKKDISIFYRGLDLSNIKINKLGDLKLIFIGRLVTLKGVKNLIEVYKNLGINYELIIIGDGDEKNNLENISKGFNIKFLGFKNREYIIKYLSENNCILVNPSYQEGMPTTVIEGLSTGNIVVASDVGGTKEISENNDLILFESGNKEELKEKINYGIEKYDEFKGLSLELINNRFNRENNIVNFYNLIK